MPLKKRPKPKPIKTPPRKMRTDDLCKSLVTIAAFNLNENPQTQMKVYEAVRRLQMLDAAAVEAGILPRACSAGQPPS